VGVPVAQALTLPADDVALEVEPADELGPLVGDEGRSLTADLHVGDATPDGSLPHRVIRPSCTPSTGETTVRDTPREADFSAYVHAANAGASASPTS
jgi:hypothetical protein